MMSILLAFTLIQAQPGVEQPAPVQTPAAATAIASPAPPVTAPATAIAATPVLGDEAKAQTKKTAQKDDGIGCVERTGSRIRRHDKANCDNGRSISKQDIDRAGGKIAPYSAPAVPAASGN